MGNKILVTGATGKVGADVVKALAARGETVKAATRHPDEYRPAPGVETTGFDYDEHASIQPALADVDRVFMISKWTDEHPEQKLNRLVELSRVAGVKHIVLLTPRAIDRDAAGPLGLVEKRIEGSGIAYTLLHPNWFMQNFTHGVFLPAIRDVSLLAAPAGYGEVSFVDTRDIAEVVADAFSGTAHAGQTYELTGGRAVSYREAADIVSEAAGRPIVYQDPSPEDVRSLLSGYGWDSEDVDHILGLFDDVRAGQAAAVTPTLGQLLGREPTTFEQFARDHAHIWR
jgi:uncharacterized protein YbjT (DUF2867 family)